MSSRHFRTLAYTKSPKTSKRTTFQDELQAAVSARAGKTQPDRYSYSDDFNEDEDDFLNELLKARRNKKGGAFKTGKSKAKINDFDISDDEDKHGRTKRVSFLKTQRNGSPSETAVASESRENEPPDRNTDNDNSFSSQQTTNLSEDNVQFRNTDGESSDLQITRGTSSQSLSFQTSDDTLLDMPLPLPSDSSVMETQGPEERSDPSPEESSQTPQFDLNTSIQHVSSADSAADREPPRPKPRQRTIASSLQTTEKIAEDGDAHDLSRPQTSSASIPLSTGTSSNITWSDGDHAAGRSKSSSSKSELSELMTKSTIDSGSRDDFISDDSKEPERKDSASFEEIHQDSDQLSHVHDKSSDTRTSSSHSKTTQRPRSVCSMKVESKYLGSLKFLDRRVSQQESQLQAADSLRAAVYQEWLQMKKEKSRERMEQKRKEDALKEKKKMDEEAKKEDAVASYEAWKEKKAESLKAKAKEKQEMIRKEQRKIEEKEEKRQSAMQVFEKWKEEHDEQLKEKYRKQREAKYKLQLKKQEKEEERSQDCKSAFSTWQEKKKNVLLEKVTIQRKEVNEKEEEEQYMKEERDKMALEMYESWLARKDLEQKRQREERRIKAILEGSPPPPWSPPNKTIPFRK